MGGSNRLYCRFLIQFGILNISAKASKCGIKSGHKDIKFYFLCSFHLSMYCTTLIFGGYLILAILAVQENSATKYKSANIWFSIHLHMYKS